MITRENLPEVIKMITKKQHRKISITDKEYVVLNLNIFNTGSTLDISVTNDLYGNKEVRRAKQNGGCVLEKNEVLKLIKNQN